jgi:uncharacterized coiled-coil protein SlyX
MLDLFGFDKILNKNGERLIERREIVKGAMDMAFDSYEKQLAEQKDIIESMQEEISELKQKLKERGVILRRRRPALKEHSALWDERHDYIPGMRYNRPGHYRQRQQKRDKNGRFA